MRKKYRPPKHPVAYSHTGVCTQARHARPHDHGWFEDRALTRPVSLINDPRRTPHFRQRSSRPRRPAHVALPGRRSPHAAAMRQLVKRLQACAGLEVSFHDGLAVVARRTLVAPGMPVDVAVEVRLQLPGYVSRVDVLVRSPAGPIVCVIEVRQSHRVAGDKHLALTRSGLPCVEVSAQQVLANPAGTICADQWWGVPDLPPPLTQPNLDWD